MSLPPIDKNQNPLNELLEIQNKNQEGDDRNCSEIESNDQESAVDTLPTAEERTEHVSSKEIKEDDRYKDSSAFDDKDNDEAREDFLDSEDSSPPDSEKEKENAVGTNAPVGAESTTATVNPALGFISAGSLVSPKLSLNACSDKALAGDQAIALDEPHSPYHLYQQMLALEEQELVLNIEEFTCGVCLVECGAGEGAVLRECLHTYCRGCLIELIRHCDDEVACPYRDDTYSCGAVLRESEVRALVSAADYEARLDKTLRLAGARMKDAFHCRTPNCAGWCVHDDQTEAFTCPLCRKDNCIRCEAIHERKTCVQFANEKQWQNSATEDVANSIEMGTAMHCPTCKVVVMKMDGCDWVMCAICKTEICWVRRMARWGPRGVGDHSGGCQCRRYAGKLCHPACRNCH